MKIAYFSPFEPMQSGISDFSEELIVELGKSVELELFTPVYKEYKNNTFPVHSVIDYDEEALRKTFDLAVFHIGNNYQFHIEIVEMFMKYGGVLELHDLALHHFLVEATLQKGDRRGYVDAMKYCHGEQGKKCAQDFLAGKRKEPWISESLQYSVNKYLLDRSSAVIVHSEYAYEFVKAIVPQKPVVSIELHAAEIVENAEAKKQECCKRLGINPNELILGAYGNASAEKRIMQILEALSLLNKTNRNFHLYIVGKVSGIDIEKEIKRLHLTDQVTITGHVSLDDFNAYIGACDVAFNLRYPTQGESSASLARLLGMGKTVFVTDIGSFSQYPDDVLIKIPYGQKEIPTIHKVLAEFFKNENVRKQYEKCAVEYAKKNCSLEKNAIVYCKVFQELCENKILDESYEDTLLDALFDLGLTDEKYVNQISDKIVF